jgi:serine/threonine protein kinase
MLTGLKDNVLISSDGQVKLSDFGLTIDNEEALRFQSADLYSGTLRWMVCRVLSAESHFIDLEAPARHPSL